MIALLAGEPALAQHKSPGPPAPALKSRQEIEAERAAEIAYRNSLRSIPDQGPTDPWGTVRETSPRGDAKKSPSKTHTKTGNAGN
jgi:hypothetical protein